ncbi:hypothetical protein [Methanoplanus endosymbiosus]|uniref:Uncharacterized protein n=1 Tax=Methanoplanus endosymbiosus TaxID=33865 RepID=A0A9E7PPY2_9EURY|nr:hypothetical protein [Methanoplanus endosymbiosus]UUX92706.1 hypothetical protein L6E24_00845 [Methanoplanus endosymbiosus]
MDDNKWFISLAGMLVFTSFLLYFLHYLIFHDLHHIELFALHELAFLPIEVLIVTLVIHRMLDNREKKKKLEKMNMVIGTFFSVIGTELLEMFSKDNPDIEDAGKELKISGEWTDRTFREATERIQRYSFEISESGTDICLLKNFMEEKEDFLIRMLENPVLLEHESFTDLLQATFHLAEELHKRTDISLCPDTDIKHLEGDINRVYSRLVIEWLSYLKHLKDNFPYLFSLAIRTNPFDKDAEVFVRN